MKSSETARYLAQYLKDNENEFLVDEIEGKDDEFDTYQSFITIDRSNLEKIIQDFYESLP